MLFEYKPCTRGASQQAEKGFFLQSVLTKQCSLLLPPQQRATITTEEGSVAYHHQEVTAGSHLDGEELPFVLSRLHLQRRVIFPKSPHIIADIFVFGHL